MGLISYIDNLLFKITEDETEKWLRFHDELDKRYATGGLQERPKALFKPEPSREDANPPRLGEDKMGTKFDIVVDLLKKDRITRNESRILLSEDSEERKMTNPEANSSMRNKLTNSYNNQFILQSNSSTHKSSYQCVVCGSFSVEIERGYINGRVVERIMTCRDCNNKFSEKE